ncbi:MAG TPA: VWA domain-containing protein [Vicinamibacterales bacterium]
MTRRVALVLLAIVATASLLRGQNQPQPTFRVRVDAVEIDASVTDASGNPVTNLTADDFEILEDRKPQVITSFTLVNIPVERVERPLFGGQPIEPDVITNQNGEGRLYVFVLDEVAPEQALRTRKFLRRFIEQYFGANDIAAVSFLGRASAANAQGLTSNARLLLESIDKFTGGFPKESVSIDPGTGVTGPSQLSAPITEAMLLQRNTMASLRSIAEAVAAIKGRRKMLLLVSDNLPVNMQRVIDYSGGTLSLPEEDAHKAITAATRSNVTIYSIDPRGLSVDGGLGDSETAPTIASDMDHRMNMDALARVTGGFALTNTNSFDQAFSRIVRENSSYYVLGYSSTNDRRDGRYRRLEVRVKRPGLQVRARGGYLGPMGRERLPVEAPARTPLNPAVTNAVRSPVATTGIPLRVFAAPYKSAQGEASIALAFEMEGSAFNLVERNGLMVGGVEVSYLATDGQNKIHPGEFHIADLSLKPDAFERLQQKGLRVLSEMHLPRGRFQIRVAVGDRTGKSGSVVYDVEVPDFARAPLVMSGVSLTSKALSDVTTMRPKDPLKGVLPGPITAAREFPRGDVITLFAEIYENAAKAIHTIELTAELRSEGGRAVGRVNEQRSSTELQGKSGGYGFTAALPLNVDPGRYVIHVEGRSSTGDRPSVSREILIRVR